MKTMHLFTVGIVITALLISALYYSNKILQKDLKPTDTAKGAEVLNFDIPVNYEECLSFDEDFVVSKNSYDCTIQTTNNQLDDTSTALYRACMAKHGFVDTTRDNCTWVGDKNNANVPKTLKCDKNGVITSVNIGKLKAVCEIVSHNKDYNFPKSYEECIKDGGNRLESYVGGSICEITISDKDTVDKNSQNALYNKCNQFGGKLSRYLNRYNVCTLSINQNVSM